MEGVCVQQRGREEAPVLPLGEQGGDPSPCGRQPRLQVGERAHEHGDVGELASG